MGCSCRPGQSSVWQRASIRRVLATPWALRFQVPGRSGSQVADSTGECSKATQPPRPARIAAAATAFVHPRRRSVRSGPAGRSAARKHGSGGVMAASQCAAGVYA
ncbi:hypothetical protein [Lysobacter gummosus]|uniref:hypothetical protein n=1 Tax=Lysobacter gummosus TaxID=262324 RepID=UPI00362F97F0